MSKWPSSRKREDNTGVFNTEVDKLAKTQRMAQQTARSVIRKGGFCKTVVIVDANADRALETAKKLSDKYEDIEMAHSPEEAARIVEMQKVDAIAIEHSLLEATLRALGAKAGSIVILAIENLS